MGLVRSRTISWLYRLGLTLAFASASPTPAAAASAPEPVRPRLIVLTDIGNEPDDAESLVRLLVYANAFEIEALVATTSTHQRDRIRPDLIEDRVRAYGQVLANLRRHAPGYPDADVLLRRIRRGASPYGMASVRRGALSDGARAIVESVDRPDPRPLWVTVWGGAADLAQALRHVRDTRPPAALARFVAKLRVYSISDQDDAGPWLRTAFPTLFWIASIHAAGQYPLATWSGISAPVAGADPDMVSNAWLTANIRAKGALSALYPEWLYLMEGDTPSFLYLLPNGLGSAEHPDWGSWGGRHGRLSPSLGLWTDVQDSATGRDGATVTSNHATVWRWRRAFQNDFAARMAWTVTADVGKANHPPEPVVNGVAGTAPIEIAACPGQPVPLSASGSRDPDGDMLTLNWWWYGEATGMHPPPLRLLNARGASTQVVVDPWRRGDAPVVRFHVVLEATDDGTPALTRYRRVVVSVPRDACTTATPPLPWPRPAAARSGSATP